MVAELVRAPIIALAILKVEGSNPGVVVYFRVSGNGRTKAIIRDFSRVNAHARIFTHAHTRAQIRLCMRTNLDFWNDVIYKI